VLKGPYHQLLPGRRAKPAGKLERKTSLIFMANYERAHGGTYWTHMKSTFKKGEPIACVVEWMKHDGLEPTWELIGPGGEKVTYKKHPVPGGSNISWEYFPKDKQIVGEWQCRVFDGSNNEITISFEIVD
jgi:hypothetical protein